MKTNNALPLIQMNAGTRLVARQTVRTTFSLLVEAFPAKAAPIILTDIAVLPELAPDEPLPARCILNLHDPSHVAASTEAPSEISWVSVRPPSGLLGPLEEGFQGAWFDGSAHLHLQLGHEAECYGILPGHSTGYLLGLLAAITYARQAGLSHREVVSALRPLLEFSAETSDKTPAPIRSTAAPSLIAA